MYKIVYDTDDGKRQETHYKDAFAYADAKYIIDSLIKDSSVLDIYLCHQVQRINAYQERKCKLSSLYGMVVSK